MNKTYLAIGIAVAAVVIIVAGGIFISSFVGFKPVIAPQKGQETTTQSDDWFKNRKVVGACYIPDDSQCLEYLGKAYTQDMIKNSLCLNEGAQILKTCPSGMAGGCHTMINNKDMEIISWNYPGGHESVTPQNIGSFIATCSMLSGLWIDPSGNVITKP